MENKSFFSLFFIIQISIDHEALTLCRYEDDPIIGHRLYRETRKVELKKPRLKGSHVLPSSTYQWETVATNFDEFQDVAVSFLSQFFSTRLLTSVYSNPIRFCWSLK